MGYRSIVLAPVYVYATIIAVFASYISPFAGFLASGLKRAYQIKDFANTLPCHGGFTDRLDCICLM